MCDNPGVHSLKELSPHLERSPVQPSFSPSCSGCAAPQAPFQAQHFPQVPPEVEGGGEDRAGASSSWKILETTPDLVQSSWHGHGSPGDFSGLARDALCCPGAGAAALGVRDPHRAARDTAHLTSPHLRNRAGLAWPHLTTPLRSGVRRAQASPHPTGPHGVGTPGPFPAAPGPTPSGRTAPRSPPSGPGTAEEPGGARGVRAALTCARPGHRGCPAWRILGPGALPRRPRAPGAAPLPGPRMRDSPAQHRPSAGQRPRTWRRPGGLQTPREERPIPRRRRAERRGLC